jgi:proteasome lid subunit RPN8/RPN11
MTLITSRQLLSEIWRHGQSAYPEEGAGLLLGQVRGEDRIATVLRPLPNSFRAEARSRRYQISPQEMMAAEDEADALGLQLIGVFHSHPDHPAVASEFDREWGLPWFSYLITSVAAGRAVESRSWRLLDDRSRMVEETLSVLEEVSS